MSEPIENVPPVDDEAALDAELQASIAAVQAGQSIADTPQTPPASETPSGNEPSVPEKTGEGDGTPQEPEPTGDAEFRIPNKGKFESDEAYEKRVELFDLVKRRKAATTPEAKALLSEEIKKAKGDLKLLGNSERFTQTKTDNPNPPDEDPDVAADRERLRQLGGATKEDIAEILQQERTQLEIQNNLETFVSRKPELADEDVRDVFFEFVDANYVWQGKSGKDLLAVLEMAHDAMFRPAETISDRVLKAAGVAEKVNAVQFPGVTGSRPTYSPELQRSIDELKATGMSEEKALELLSDD